MEDQALQFDRKKHLCYSKTVKEVIRRHLTQHYEPELAERYWEDTQRAYVEILELMPYMGGKKNFQASSVYDCAALFAYYRAVPDKPTLEEFGQMNDELFLPALEKKTFVNLNNPLFMKLAGLIWSRLSKVSRRRREDWPGNYHMEMRSCPEGKKYVFLRCPIAELAKKLGYTHLMPAMCNPDYPMLRYMHAGLIRTTTCAFGEQCDFWIVGDQSQFLEQYPVHRDEAGYLVNEKKK